jgi:putative transposase
VAELSRKHGFPEVTLYTWKSKYGGEDVSESKRLRDVQADNTKLKKLLAERLLDQAALKNSLPRKW